jgi:predicted nucleic acid-binding protein
VPGEALFIDTSYLVALIDPGDSRNEEALRLTRSLAGRRALLVTTDAVLIELGNYFSRSPLRVVAARWIAALRGDAGWEVIALSSDLVAAGEDRYRRFADKAWSTTDCISMEVMRRRRIREVATADHGFAQAGFSILLP